MIWYIIKGCGKVKRAIADGPEDWVSVPHAAAFISSRGKVKVVRIAVTIFINICAVRIVKGSNINIKRYCEFRPPSINCIKKVMLLYINN